MINKEKLSKFLIGRTTEANLHSARSSGAEYYYQLGQARATAEIIIKLDAGEFDEKERTCKNAT